MSDFRQGRTALMTGGLAAILASGCCLGPLVLVTLGFSGAWIGTLTVLEPFRPWFIGAAVIAMLLAYHRIFHRVRDCKPDEVCALPPVRRSYQILFWIVVALVAVAIGFPYVLPQFY